MTIGDRPAPLVTAHQRLLCISSGQRTHQQRTGDGPGSRDEILPDPSEMRPFQMRSLRTERTGQDIIRGRRGGGPGSRDEVLPEPLGYAVIAAGGTNNNSNNSPVTAPLRSVTALLRPVTAPLRSATSLLRTVTALLRSVTALFRPVTAPLRSVTALLRRGQYPSGQ